MTRAERQKLRKNLYLLALGPLKLQSRDLWSVTNGELCDMIAGYHYRLFCERQEQALHTTALLNMWSKRKITVQDFTGIWKDGRILSKEEFFDEWKQARMERKNSKLRG